MQFPRPAELASDLVFAARTLRRSPGFAVVAVLSLACGFALAATTMAVVNAYLIRSLPYPGADRLYAVMYAPPGPNEPRGITALDWTLLRDVVEFSAASGGETYYLTENGVTQTVPALRVSPGFAQALNLQPFLGRSLSDAEYQRGAENVALITQALWRSRFGADPQIVGRQLQVNPESSPDVVESLRIVGVLPPMVWYRPQTRSPDIFVPMRAPARAYLAQLRAGVPVAFAEKRLTEVVRSVATSLPPNWPGVRLESIHHRYVAGIRPMLLAVAVAAGLVLTIAAANVAVLVLLRALRRQKEIAVRLALGAGRMQIARMLVAESGVICIIALVGGLTLTAVALRSLSPLIETQLNRPARSGVDGIGIDSTVLLVIGGAGLVVAVVLSLVPLVTLWRSELIDTLRRVGASGGDGRMMRRLRGTLIAFEIAGAFALVVGCGLMVRSAVNLLRTDFGYDVERVARGRVIVPAQKYPEAADLSRFFEKLEEPLSTLTRAAPAFSNRGPHYEPPSQPVEFDGRVTGQEALKCAVTTVGRGYFTAFGVPVQLGRNFSAQDRFGSEPVAIVSESLAQQLWPGENALGRRIRTGESAIPDAPLGTWRTVVGVVRDVRQIYDDRELRDLYLPFLQAPVRFGSFYLRTDQSLPKLSAGVREMVAQHERLAVVNDIEPIVQSDRQRADTRFLAGLMTAFAGLAAVLAGLGIYGVTAYAAQQREREVAIRIALGAGGAAIVRMFVREAGLVVALGIAGGLAGAIAVTRILAAQLFNVGRFDALTLVAAGGLIGLLAGFATWWPARRAAKTDPMAVLKES